MLNKLLLIFLLVTAVAIPQRKKDFDITDQKLLKSAVLNSSNLFLSNQNLEMTMIAGGYFTLGTSQGEISTKLDDNCQITFGHPYAMTSYPLVSVDGQWMKADEFSGSIMVSGDTISFKGDKNNLFSLDFSMILQQSGVKFIHTLKNNDTSSHSLGSGIVLDPALGKWGDGSLIVNDKIIRSDTLMELSSSQAVTMWEKSEGAHGIGAQITSSEALKIIVENWNISHNHFTPEFIKSELSGLYDIVMRMYFMERTLQAGEQISSQLELLLLTPDFSSGAFTRWDVPSYLDITDNIMFPRRFDTYAEVYNTKSAFSNYQVDVEFTASLTSDKQNYEFGVEGNSSYFNQLKLQSKLSFEEDIITATLKVKDNGNVVDQFKKNIFIPATPVSDTGLIVVSDSVSTKNFPTVDLFFGVEQESKGQRILNLQKENIYLYENGKRVDDYNLSRFGSGGSSLADVVFVLDVSGSMGDKIAQVRNNLNEFADSLEKRGYDYKIGIVTFSTTVDHVWDLTTDLTFLKQQLSQIVLWGGVEDSPSALMEAAKLSFRPGSKRTFIWVTDESYPEDKFTKLKVVDEMLLKDIVVHGVGTKDLQTDWFNPIVLPTGGNFYDIYGNFRDILLDVTRMEAQDMYHVSYQSKLPSGEQKELTLKVYFGGLGVIKSYVLSQDLVSEGSTAHLRFYPNPFNPEITFLVNTSAYTKGEIKIFSILGECVKTFHIDNPVRPQITWNAKNEMGTPVSTGFYIVQLIMTGVNNKIYQESAKILYLK